MRILDSDNNIAVKDVVLLLTYQEACELASDLSELVKKEKSTHVHINDMDYQHEITIAIYGVNNLNGFTQRVKQLICVDE